MLTYAAGERRLRAVEDARAKAAEERRAAEGESERARKEEKQALQKLGELETLLIRSQEQGGVLKEENWALQQRLEQAARGRAELERDSALLVKVCGMRTHVLCVV